MATSLLEPDSSVWNTPLLLKGDDTPDALRPDPQADALGQTYSAITDAMARQQQQSADQGLWDNTTGLPTQKGLLDAIGQTGTAVALGTGSGGDAPAPGFTAYHGSPHAFDQFDLSKIGTGEGAQAYGHGMYLADSEGVARSYRDALSGGPPEYHFGGDPILAVLNRSGDDPAKFLALGTLHDSGNLFAAQQKINSYASFDRDYRAAKEWMDANVKDITEHQQAPGHMYEVNVNADPATFLDWDKPLSEQHPDVQDRVGELVRNHQIPRNNNAGGETTGGQLVQYLNNKFNDTTTSADELNYVGIPGIRYLDAGSRGAGEGTKNTVVFDPATMDIIRRYGLAGLMAGGGAAALGGQSGQQQ